MKVAVMMVSHGSGLKSQEPGTVSTAKGQGFLLPPAPGKCQECAVAHKPEEHHNKDSLYYQMAFRQKHGRWPTWADAIAHCSEAAKGAMKQILEEKGVWSEPVENLTEEERTARTLGDMPTHSQKPDGGAVFGQVIEVKVDGGKKRSHHGPRTKNGRGQSGKARGRGRGSP